MGTIYLITCTINGMMYVGQTRQIAQRRWTAHKKAAKNLARFKNGEIEKCEDISSYLYNSMVKYGIENFEFKVILDDIEDDLIDQHEIDYIEIYNTLKPNGFNLTTGGGGFKHHDDTKLLMRELAINAAPGHIDKWRKEETKGLPMYIVSHNKGNSKGFAVCGHPLCSYKSFTLSDYKTLDECKQTACKFLEDLETNKVQHVFKKTDAHLPVGITRFRTGYLVKRKINNVVHKRTFEGKNIDDAIKLDKAIEYLNSLPN